MSELSLGVTIEIVVAILLVLTICYCVVLNKRLRRLHSDEEALRATIGELITATEIAERAIIALKNTAGDADKSLASKLAEAERFSRDLARQVNSGEIVLNRISQIAEAAAASRAEVEAAPAKPEPVEEVVVEEVTPEPEYVEPVVQKSNSARDLSKAAAEAAARLGEMRSRGAEWAA
ncbi:MAG: DUF6468 domain-containing protein [Stappiaceae bacterium]